MLKSVLQYHSSKASILQHSAFFTVQLSHLYMTTRKIIALTIWSLSAKWCLCFGKQCLGLSQLFFQGASIFLFHCYSRHPQWFWSPSKKVCDSFHFLPIYLSRSDGTRCHDLHFWMLIFKTVFSLSSFTFIKRLFSSSSLFAIKVVLPAHLRLLIFLLATMIPTWASSSPAFHMMYSAISHISRVIIYSLDILLSQFWTSLLFHVQF